MMNVPLTEALARIDDALTRIEAIAEKRTTDDDSDSRYARLRARTHSALAQLDQVIARAVLEQR